MCLCVCVLASFVIFHVLIFSGMFCPFFFMYFVWANRNGSGNMGYFFKAGEDNMN